MRSDERRKLGKTPVDEPWTTRPVRIDIIGASGVGKSHLISALMNGQRRTVLPILSIEGAKRIAWKNFRRSLSIRQRVSAGVVSLKAVVGGYDPASMQDRAREVALVRYLAETRWDGRSVLSCVNDAVLAHHDNPRVVRHFLCELKSKITSWPFCYAWVNRRVIVVLETGPAQHLHYRCETTPDLAVLAERMYLAGPPPNLVVALVAEPRHILDRFLERDVDSSRSETDLRVSEQGRLSTIEKVVMRFDSLIAQLREQGIPVLECDAAEPVISNVSAVDKFVGREIGLHEQ